MPATALTITPATLPNGTVGTVYTSTTFTATGGTGTITWSLDSGTLPPGLVLSGGTLSGTPTTAGTYTFTIKATDGGSGATATQAYTVTISPVTLNITPATLPNGTVGTAYTSTTFTATGGTGNINWNVTAGNLPSGLTLVGDTLSGTPTAAGTYTFTIEATDASGNKSSLQYTVTIQAPPALTITPATLPSGSVGVVYTTTTFTATGGTGPFTWSSTGNLPSGLTLVGDTLSGTPTAAGSYTFTITVSNSLAQSGSRQYTVTIGSAPALKISPSSLSFTAGTSVNTTFTAANAIGGVTWSSSGTLPQGVTFNAATGTLSGTPTTAGSYNFTITATDGNGRSAFVNFVGNVTPAAASGGVSLERIDAGALKNATAGEAYDITLAAKDSVGKTVTVTWAVVDGALPDGLTLDASTGRIYGTPTKPGTFEFTIEASDASGRITQPMQMSISEAPSPTTPSNGEVVITTDSSLPSGTVGMQYSVTLTATGNPNSWAISAGTRPDGLVLDDSGVFSGYPQQKGSYSFTVRAKNNRTNKEGSKSFTITITN